MRQCWLMMLMLLVAASSLSFAPSAMADKAEQRQAFMAYILERFDRNRDGVINGYDWRVFSKQDKYFLVMNDLMTLNAILYPDPGTGLDEAQFKHMTFECVFGLDGYYQKNENAKESVIDLVAKVFNAEYHE